MQAKRKRTSIIMSFRKSLKRGDAHEYSLKINQFEKLCVHNSEKGPGPRSGHRIVCNERMLLSIGGYNHEKGEGVLLREVWLFDFVNDTWKQLQTENLPHELASAAAVLSGNLLFVYGGTGAQFGLKINEDVHVCDVRSSETTLVFRPIPISNNFKPPKRYGQSVVIKDLHLYTVGGTDGSDYSLDVYRLDIETRTWTTLYRKRDKPPYTSKYIPAGRYRHEMVFYNNYLYILGGGTSTSAFDLKEIPAFNLDKLEWEKFITHPDVSAGGSYPSDRKCHGCVQHPHDSSIVFISGGSNLEQVFRDTWKLDLKLLTWTRISSLRLPHPLYFHDMATTPDGRMLVFGGINQASGKRSSKIFSAWLTIPKLKHACWEAVAYYLRTDQIRLPTEELSYLMSMKGFV